MDIKNALKTMQLGKKHGTTKQLCTTWGEALLKTNAVPLTEYPRPQLKRNNNYQILNGFWDYCITTSKKIPTSYTGQIRVPFSPETLLSGVEKILKPTEYLWYHKTLTLKEHKDMRLLLHFGAIDQIATVYLNGQKVARHTGGYLPFTVDLTPYAKNGLNHLHVQVTDSTDLSYHSRGKQRLKHKGMFYTPQSGIWQTVWLEDVPLNYITNIKLTPIYDEKAIQVKLMWNRKPSQESLRRFEIYYHGKLLVSHTTTKDCVTFLFKDTDFHPWTPEAPDLYDLRISCQEDSVESYFALRKVSVEKDTEGTLRIFLNDKPYFMNGILDQGYWPESLMTSPCDEAMVYDIMSMKKLGFNTIRKHCKLEPDRFYYHCDRLGMLVWQDMVNGGGAYNAFLVTYLPTILSHFHLKISDTHYWLTARQNSDGRRQWMRECEKTIITLYNHPSIVVWVPFNEGWGQFDARFLYRYLNELDSTRLIDHASGWFDQGYGDFLSEHNYFFELKVKKDTRRAYILSEYGGYACHLKEHAYSPTVYGYQNYNSIPALRGAVTKLFAKIDLLQKEGLAAAIYTQLSDIEEEVNGILTYDRKINKFTE